MLWKSNQVEKRVIYAKLKNQEEDVIIHSLNDHCNEHEEALSRMTSTALRHGADIQFVVHQLEKVKGDMLSFARSMARSLKKYVKDGSKVWGEECKSCGKEDSLSREGGCIICKNCGWSKCA